MKAVNSFGIHQTLGKRPGYYRLGIIDASYKLISPYCSPAFFPLQSFSSEMASNLTVKVHPVVYMTIVDSYMRRARPTKTGQQAPDKVLGTLLGFYEKGAIQV